MSANEEIVAVNNNNNGYSIGKVQLFISKWFYFDLPMGSALILVAVLDMISVFFETWMAIKVEYYYQDHHYSHIWATAIVDLIMMSIFALYWLIWYKIIVKGSLRCTKTLLLIQSIGMVLHLFFWGNLIYYNRDIRFFIGVFAFILDLLIPIYTIYMIYQCYLVMKNVENPLNLLTPIGLGLNELIAFYKGHLKILFKIMLMLEVLSIVDDNFVSEFRAEMLDTNDQDFDDSQAIFAEEYILSMVRLCIVSSAFYILYKRTFSAFKYWLVFYVGTIIQSCGILAYIILFDFWEFNADYYIICYYLRFAANIVYRGLVACVCFKIIQHHCNEYGEFNDANVVQVEMPVEE